MKHSRKRYEEITLMAMQGLLANPANAMISDDDLAILASEQAYAMIELFDRESTNEGKDND